MFSIRNFVFVFACALMVGLVAIQLNVLAAPSQSSVSAPLSDPISDPISSPSPEPTATPTPEPTQPPSSGGDSGSGSNPGGGSGSTCSDAKPGSAPKLISAVSKKPNQVILTWQKAADPVSYYLVSYGANVFANQFGNPNIGGAQTTSYVVSGLSGNTLYYFRVRAGNGCTPGDFSNVLSVRANGRSFSKPATGFKPGVLAAKTVQKAQPAITPKAAATVAPTPTPTQTQTPANSSFINKVKGFFSNIFVY